MPVAPVIKRDLEGAMRKKSSERIVSAEADQGLRSVITHGAQRWIFLQCTQQRIVTLPNQVRELDGGSLRYLAGKNEEAFSDSCFAPREQVQA